MNIAVDGINTSYVDEGNGKVVVLLHGWGTSKENLQDLQHFLAKDFRVIVPDLPGFGESALPPKDWSVGNYVSFIQSFLETLDVHQVHAIVGHSFGGRVCIKGAGSHTFSPSKIVLIGSAGIRHSTSLRNRAVVATAKTGKTILRLPLLRKHYDTARAKLHQQTGSDDYASAGEMQQVFLNTIQEDLQEVAANIKADTLLIWGSEDQAAPLADARRFNQLIEGSRLKIIQGAGHFVHNDNPQKVQKWVAEFLS
ncbi:MAG TPA: alpha/beta hydrolase [Candidatus Saccharibacteria bacterium]|nr:alpha/beta hydrolase [Candidatus Saccharibacteria bacterium]